MLYTKSLKSSINTFRFLYPDTCVLTVVFCLFVTACLVTTSYSVCKNIHLRGSSSLKYCKYQRLAFKSVTLSPSVCLSLSLSLPMFHSLILKKHIFHIFWSDLPFSLLPSLLFLYLSHSLSLVLSFFLSLISAIISLTFQFFHSKTACEVWVENARPIYPHICRSLLLFLAVKLLLGNHLQVACLFVHQNDFFRYKSHFDSGVKISTPTSSLSAVTEIFISWYTRRIYGYLFNCIMDKAISWGPHLKAPSSISSTLTFD